MNRIERRRAALCLIEQLNNEFRNAEKDGNPTISLNYIKQELFGAIRATAYVDNKKGVSFVIGFYMFVEDSGIRFSEGDDIDWCIFNGNIKETVTTINFIIKGFIKHHTVKQEKEQSFRDWRRKALSLEFWNIKNKQ